MNKMFLYRRMAGLLFYPVLFWINDAVSLGIGLGGVVHQSAAELSSVLFPPSHRMDLLVISGADYSKQHSVIIESRHNIESQHYESLSEEDSFGAEITAYSAANHHYQLQAELESTALLVNQTKTHATVIIKASGQGGCSFDSVVPEPARIDLSGSTETKKRQCSDDSELCAANRALFSMDFELILDADESGYLVFVIVEIDEQGNLKTRLHSTGVHRSSQDGERLLKYASDSSNVLLVPDNQSIILHSDSDGKIRRVELDDEMTDTLGQGEDYVDSLPLVDKPYFVISHRGIIKLPYGNRDESADKKKKKRKRKRKESKSLNQSVSNEHEAQKGARAEGVSNNDARSNRVRAFYRMNFRKTFYEGELYYLLRDANLQGADIRKNFDDNIQQLLLSKQPARAIEYIDNVLLYYPEFYAAIKKYQEIRQDWRAIVHDLETLKLHESAVDFMEAILKESPSDDEVMDALIWNLTARAKIDRAIKNLTMWKERNPESNTDRLEQLIRNNSGNRKHSPSNGRFARF